MNPSDSVKNIVSIILDISTKDLIFLTHHLRREMCFRQVEESDEGLGIRTINKETGKKSVNFELLFRKEKKHQRDLRDKLEEDEKRIFQEQAHMIALKKQTDLETDLEKDAQDQMIVLEPESTCDVRADFFVNTLTKSEVRKQKNIKPVYKNLRLKSQKKMDKEKRAKRKPANLFN